jgi:uncharacterized membrane protein YgcG
VRRLLALLLLALAAAAAPAQERITDFAADIAIGADGVLTVTETIAVQVEGREIRRGILRDFPTEYRDRAGNKVRVPFEVLAVRRNGAPENYAVEPLDNGARVRIGNANVTLPRGEHTYTIAYRTARQIGFFPTHDELYWNVTGNGWTFAIDRARARVTLPQPLPADRLGVDGYTGPQGASGTDFRAQVIDGGGEYETTRRLAPREGLTIVLGFPKGVVSAPSALQKARWFLRDNVGAGVALGGLLLVCAFLYWRWDRIGRDPKPGPLFPRYEPPRARPPGSARAVRPGAAAGAPGEGSTPMGPASVRFVDRMGADSRCFAAALLGLGARGYLTVDQHGEGFTLTRTGRDVPFATGERAMCEQLFAAGKVRDIGRKYDPSVAAAQKALQEALEREYEGVLFRRNRAPLVLGGLAGAGTVVAAAALGAAVPVLIGAAVLLAGAMLLGAHLMPAYSVQGRRLKDEIDGLRLYLGVAEGDNLARMQAPRLTPEEFARQLPYALALGVEKTWADRFAALLGAAAVAQAVSSYYHGTDAGSFGAGSFASGLDAMGSTVSAAASPPGSRSGSGGGGSSGGGGGGGGGSGW